MELDFGSFESRIPQDEESKGQLVFTMGLLMGGLDLAVCGPQVVTPGFVQVLSTTDYREHDSERYQKYD